MDNENEKINAIRTLLNRNLKESSISDELRVLLSDKCINEINQEVALVWEQQATLTQKLSQLALLATNDQKRIMGEIFEASDSLKKTAAKATTNIEEERKKLIVIQEVFRKKTSEKAFNKSFKDKSFKLALEELLEEKSGVASKKRRPRKILEEEDDEEGDNTKFFSMVEFKEEIEHVKQSFMVPVVEVVGNEKAEQSSGKKKDEADKAVASTDKRRELHPFKKRLVENNPVFKEFPVKGDNPVRDKLPILRDPNVKINIWAILKENIGKDLSKITMPVYMNEPISLVQKQSEMLEYCELFRKANNCDNQFLRIVNVFSGFFMVMTNAPGRMKKPFNSLLGETFELIADDLKYISEQVSHHPPICAFYGECSDFVIEGDFQLKSKLSISGFEFFQQGSIRLRLKKTNEVFERTKFCVASLHNYIIGKPYLWFNGDSVITNATTSDTISVSFKPKGWTSKNDYEVEGLVKNKQGEVKYHVFGKWDSFISVIEADTKQEVKVAEKKETPKDSELQYNFPKFSINLNNLTTEGLEKAAPTDSRFRTDQRAYEHGNLEMASFEKNRLEENQRRRRKENEASGTHWKPLWFDFEMGEDSWKSKYKGGYFEAREKGAWPAEMLDLFND